MPRVGRIVACLVLGVLFAMTGCDTVNQTNDTQYVEEEEMTYKMITMEEAEEIFATSGDYIILDVRREDEFAEGHIPGAINIANEMITDKEIPLLPDKDKIIYVYCRSGNRSKQAAAKLVQLGYTNIIEFGGILDWDGEIEK